MIARSATLKVFRYELSDVIRGKSVIVYALFFFALSLTLIRFSGSAKALMSLINVTLIVVPLVSILFGTMYLYNARDFIEMLLVQPLSRKHMFAGLFLGLCLPLAGGFAVGTFLPFVMYRGDVGGYQQALLTLLLSGVLLTFVFVALAFLIVVFQDDKTKGLSLALFTWFFTGVIYDGLMLLIVQVFQSYPLEIPTLILTLLNPTDLARVLLMIHVDIAAMMGYTGAIFESFFGSGWGILISILSLLIWVALPLALSYRLFIRKDF